MSVLANAAPAVREVLDRVIPACGLEDHPRAVLFSVRRFKQTGACRFRDPVPRTPLAPAPTSAPAPKETLAC